MKLAKLIALSLLFFFVLSSVGGYFYFKAKFKPAANQLQLAAPSGTIPFTWAPTATDPHAALLLPVTLPGCPKTFYLQFDTGAPSTLFYRGKMEAIQKQGYALSFRQAEGQLNLANMSFKVGDLPVTAKEVKVLAYGDSVLHWQDHTAIDVIGTLGTDFLENHIVQLDYERMELRVLPKLPATVPASAFQEFTFDSRRILLPSHINGKETDLLFDTGASAYELLTDKTSWQAFAQPGQTVDTARVNSWGTTLTAYTTTTQATARFGTVALPLKRATYIEGMSTINTLLMTFSGMGGMTGNKLFLGHTLLLDMKHQKFAVL